jgi:RHS repeat-associated protein
VLKVSNSLGENSTGEFTMILSHLQRLVRISFPLIAIMLFTSVIGNGQITDPTDNGLPSGMTQGSRGTINIDNVNLFNGNLTVLIPFLDTSGRGGAKGSLMFARNSNHWTVTKIQDRNHITYTPKADLNGNAIRLPFYEPARLYTQINVNASAQCLSGISGQPATTLKRFIYIASDGTEHELRDQGTDGQPLTYTFVFSAPTAARGTVFRSADSSDLTFISDSPVFDNCNNARSENGTGYLLMRNGTRLRFVDGLLRESRDRNGNMMTYSYGTNLSDLRTYRRLISVTDSLNRTVSITYSDFGVVNPPVVLYDLITYKGFGGNSRSIKIWYTDLGQALRSGYTLQTYNCLFPNLNSSWTCGGSSGNTVFTATVVNKLELPNGDRYQFFYNPYREIARVELPTGAAIEYDYSPQNPDYTTTKFITRQVSQRRVYLNATDTVPISKQIYSFTVTVDTSVTPFVFTTTTAVEYRDPNNLLLSEQHLINGSGTSQSLRGFPPSYKSWNEGLEFQTDIRDSNGNLIKSVTNEFQNRAHVTWWPQPNSTDAQSNEPAKDPRIIEKRITLADTNQKSKQTFTYSNDLHNNITDVYDYDFGPGAPGALLRRTHTDYLTINPVNGVNYADPSNGQTYSIIDPHLRSLASQTSIYDNNNVEIARTTYEYDNYSTTTGHQLLLDRPSISGLDPSFNTAYTKRGNQTCVTGWLLPALTQIKSFSQYDIAGNVIKTIDPRGNPTTIEFADAFGSPDTEARSNTVPAELITQSLKSFAYPTKVTNALGHEAYTQFDYYLGSAVNGEDANGVVTSTEYGNGNLDQLDRPSKVISAVNKSIKSQTKFDYDDVNHIVTTLSDLNTFEDPNPLKRQVVHDGLGRVAETRDFETSTEFIAVKQTYDALGRLDQRSNPYRPPENPAWTTTDYDALGRVITVTSPDQTEVITAYSGNAVMVTDQAQKSRRSNTDGLGRLKEVIEYTRVVPNPRVVEPANGNDYLTTYDYDALSNLKTITQGGQTRTFIYDSLHRLKSATNPEVCNQQGVPLPITYDYDENGNLKTKTDPRFLADNVTNVKVTYEYDALDRVTSRTYNDGTPGVTYAYDIGTNGIGRLNSITSSVSVYSFGQYDALGRAQSTTQSTDGQPYAMSYMYDLAGNLKTQVYPSGRVLETSYDNSGRIAGVKNQTTGSFYVGAAATDSTNRIQYAAHGQTSQVRLGNGLWEHTNFNTRLQVTQIGLGTTALNSTTLQLDYGYGSANNGSLQSQTIGLPGLTLSQSYTYDDLNRLKSAQELKLGVQTWKQVFQYDRFGNRNFEAGNTTIPVPLTNLVFNATNNRFDTQAPGQTLITYDNGGNLTRDVTGNTYGYDGDNRQISFNGGNPASGGASYAYDGEGKRVKKVASAGTTIFVYNIAGQMIAEYSTANPTGPGGTNYITADNLGSPRVITKANQSVTGRHDYLPFGEEIAPSIGGRSAVPGYDLNDGLKQKFTSKERDSENGLDFFGARYYSSTQGRFTGPDPMGGSSDNPQTLNRYSYVINNPLRFNDPTGLAAQDTHQGQDQQPSQDPKKPDKPAEVDPSSLLLPRSGKGEAVDLKITELGIVGGETYDNGTQYFFSRPQGEGSPGLFRMLRGSFGVPTFITCAGCFMRGPDAIQLSWSMLFLGQSYTVDAYGRIYASNMDLTTMGEPKVKEGVRFVTQIKQVIRGLLTPKGLGVGGSAQAMYALQLETPTEAESAAVFGGYTTQIQGGYKAVGGSISFNGEGKPNQVGLGVSTTRISISTGYQHQVGSLPFGWRNFWSWLQDKLK